MRSSRLNEHPRPSGRRESNFTGVVWADPVLEDEDDVTANVVFFEPRARTHWHRHAVAQVLHVTHGYGVIATRLGQVDSLVPGDVVHIAAGEEHWHGAMPTTLVVHLAVSVGETEWLDPVSEEEYETAVFPVVHLREKEATS